MKRLISLCTVAALLLTILPGCQLINALLNLGLRLAPLVALVAMEESSTPPGAPDVPNEPDGVEFEIERALLQIESNFSGTPPTVSELISRTLETKQRGVIILLKMDPDHPEETQRLATIYRELRQRYHSVQIEPVTADDQKSQLARQLTRSRGRIRIQADAPLRGSLGITEPILPDQLAAR